MKTAVFCVLVCVLLAGCTNAALTPTVQVASQPPPANTPTPLPTNTPTARFSQIVAFGDDFSDSGAGLPILKQALAKGEVDEKSMNWYETFHWEGRLSNGPVAVEVLAEKLGVELKSYAIGGARSGYGNDNDFWVASLKNTGLLAQVDQYTQDLNGMKADPDALYFLQASTDDFLGVEYTYDEKAIQERADQNVANLVTAVTRLASLGARHFMVGKSADIARTPRIRMRELTSESKTFQDLMNAKLIAEMANLEKQQNIKIELFDYIAVDDTIWSNPDQYGFTNLTDNCLITDESQNGTICESPDNYFWWDIFSPTRRAHQVIGEAMAAQLSQ